MLGFRYFIGYIHTTLNLCRFLVIFYSPECHFKCLHFSCVVFEWKYSLSTKGHPNINVDSEEEAGWVGSG